MKKPKRRLLRSRRLMSALLCISMITSMLSGYGIVAAATEKPKDPVTDGVTRQADPSTMDTYKDVLDFTENTRYAGRLWSDKSVFAYGVDATDTESGRKWDKNSLQLTAGLDGMDGSVELDADFLHVYSVLGSSVQVNETMPADLVLALDISGSMNSPEANEDENWINTADPKDAGTFSEGLGFYKGSRDTSITDVVTTNQTYQGYAGDSNKIPDAIVPVLPSGSNTIGNSNGQMSSINAYNNYLTKCNTIVDALYDEKEDRNSDADINQKLTNAGISPSTEGYESIFVAYEKYKAAANAVKAASGDPWLSDNGKDNDEDNSEDNSEARNALWPYDELEKAISDTLGLKAPTHPMKNSDNAPNRMYYMIDAANSFIERYLALNEKNRISIVLYDSVATVLMPLAHYEKANGTSYLSAQKHHWQQWGGTGQWACTVTVNAKPTSGYANDTFSGKPLDNDGVYNASVTSWTNTGTAIALNAGLDILAQSSDSYNDMAKRLPVLILMTDGAANVATTGLEANKLAANGSFDNTIFDNWIQGAQKGTIKSSGSVFNSRDNKGNALEDIFTDGTSDELTVYGAGSGHIYGSEGDAITRYTVVLNTLMSTAFKKNQVEAHYNGKSYGDAQEKWTEASIYTIGFGLDYYSGITGVCANTLNPRDNFGGDVSEDVSKDGVDFVNAYKAMIGAYNNWKNKEAPESLNITFHNKDVPSESEIQFQINSATDGDKDDIERNIRYNTEYFKADMKNGEGVNENVLKDVFNNILISIQNEMFTPVGGSNDLGVKDSVTYMDSIGKYMEVKGVKKLLLFGELHNVVKAAVYDYSFNNEFFDRETGETFENGWYKRDENGKIIKATDNSASWETGWEYHVNTDTAAQFLPNETELDKEEPSPKIQNTTYTIYRLDYDDDSGVRNKLHMNPAYGTDADIPADVNDSNYTDTTGVYKLSDLRIWVEDTGNYSDTSLGGSGIDSDTNFDQALYVNLPASMLPLRTVTLSPETEGYTYTSNLNAFPMRLFYTVGVEESVLNSDRSINIAGGISAEYLNENSVNTAEDVANRGLTGDDVIGSLEFFSNWYNPLNRYQAYAVSNNDYTYGDPVVSFSPSGDNRYYVFEKSLPVYSKAYRYTGGTDGSWEPVVINGESPDAVSPTSFGGKVLAAGLKIETGGESSLDAKIKKALGDKSASAGEGDIVLLENALIEDTRNIYNDPDPANGADFSSDNYYYIPLEYFELGNLEEGEEKGNAQKVQYAVTRKGSEFGSAYAAAGLSNGELLCWYDASGRYYQTYPYLSYTETLEWTRGKKYIGYDNIYETDANGEYVLDADGKKILRDVDTHPDSDAKAIQDNGTWVVAAKVGGLRVGDLAKDVRNKGGKYEDYDKGFVSGRYPGYDNLTWHYSGDNTTRTANNYYVPTISSAPNAGSGGTPADAIIVNTYLGNNGRLWTTFSNSLLLTKTVIAGEGAPEDLKEKEFDYQVYIDGFTGDRDAYVMRYDNESDSWQYQLHYIDLALDPELFLQTKDGQKAMVDEAGKRVTGNADSGYTYVDGTGKCENAVYYVYIGSNTNPEQNIGSSVMRVYHNSLVDDYSIEDGITVKDANGAELSVKDLDDYNGICTFYAESVELRPVDGVTSISKDNFELLTVDLNEDAEGINPTNMTIKSPYYTQSEYWKKTLQFGLTDGDELYDETAKRENTANTTLKNGYGLLFFDMASGIKYHFTEKLTDDNIGFGCTFDHIDKTIGKNTTTYELNDSVDTENKVHNFQQADHVYSVFGETDDTYGQSVHYYNRWSDDKTETEINDKPVDSSNIKDNTYPGVQVGDEITYEIKWVNDTGDKAEVVITDPLDPGVNFKAAYIEEDIGDTGDYDEESHTVTWNLGEREKDTSGKVTLIVEVNEKAAEYWDYDQDGVGDDQVDNAYDFMVRDRATVRVADHEYYTNTVVNPVGQPSKTETAIQHGEQTDTITKDQLSESEENGDDKLYGPLVYVGDQIKYEVEWQNYKNEEATVTISDPLDPNVKFISADYTPENTTDRDGNQVENPQPDAAEIGGNTTTAGSTNDYTNADGEVETRDVLSYVAGEHKVVWNLGKQPAGAKGKVTLVVEVLESATPVGYVDNTAFVQINNEPELQTETIENPVPHEEKTETKPGNGVMLPIGGEIKYEINWHNYKTGDAHVIVMDTLDPGVDFVQADFKTAVVEGNVSVSYHGEAGDTIEMYEGGGTQTVEIPAHTVVWDLGIQPANTEGLVGLTVKVNNNAKVEYIYNEEASGLNLDGSGNPDYKVLNQARVKVGHDSFIMTQIVENPIPEKTETDVVHADNSLNPENVVLTPKEGEENTYIGPVVFVDDYITYKIHWTNGHDKPADVIVTDALDPGVDFEDAYLDGDENTKGDYDGETHTVTWTLKDQLAGVSGTVVLVVKVNEKATEAGFVDNQAQVKVGTDPAVETEIIENPTPKEEKVEVSPGEGMHVMPEDEIEYEIKWHNYHIDGAADVTITDKLDPGLDFLFASALGIDLSTLINEPESEPDVAAPEGFNEENVNGAEETAIQEEYSELTENLSEAEPGADISEESESPEGLSEESAYEPEVQTDPAASAVSESEGASESTYELKAEPDPADSEKLKIEGADEYGNKIIIEYDKESHTVIWTLENRPANSDGVVTLRVRVNKDAEKLWNYNNPDLDPSETEKDDRVLNQAGVKVGNDPEVKTRVIENPTKPGKTETEINDTDVSRDIVAGEDGYVGPDVYVGDRITYRITWQNNASDEAGNPIPAAILITDELDDGVDFVAASDNGAYDPATHKVTWDFGVQEARVRGFVTLTVIVNEKALEPGQVENEATVTVGDNPQVTDKVINKVKEDGKLTVSKTVRGDQADESKDWNFHVELSDKNINGEYGDMSFINGIAEFTLKHGESKTAEGLPANIGYEVTEAEANEDGYETSVTGDIGVIPAGNMVSVVFVNSKENGYGNLQVTKTVAGTAGDSNKDWNFHVVLSDTGINGVYGDMNFTNGAAEFTLKHGESSTARDLPANISYEVTEEEADQDGYKTTVQGAAGVIPKNNTANAVFLNSKGNTPSPEKGTGNLQVTKKVTGTAGDKNKDWHFRVELSDKSINGWYGDIFFTDGVAEFTLKHGESKTAAGLPENVTYIVTEQEANKDGYETSSKGEKGTIVSRRDIEVSFVNDKPSVPQGAAQTGDNSRLGLWIASMVVSLSGIFVSSVMLFTGRRARRRRVRVRNTIHR